MDYKTKHPALTPERQDEYKLMRHSMDGESAIKREGVIYLTKPSGFNSQADSGTAAYAAYKDRAQFPEIIAPSVAAMVGIVHGQEIQIDLPDSMQFLFEDADGEGLPLEAFHRRITRAMLVIGGDAILADAPEGGGNPYLVEYARDAVINWDTDFFVLDECGMVRSGFAWTKQEKYRVLQLESGAYVQDVYTDGVLQQVESKGKGSKRLTRIPFVVGSALDISPRVVPPPLIGVARAAKAIYQLSADYRHQLFWSGQETLLVINGEPPTAVGAGAVVALTGSDTQTPDMRYVSPSCSGIEAHKVAMEDNRTAAIQAGARLLEQSEQVQESGAARSLRFASETATLTSIAMASCGLLERALRNVAMILGLPEDGVIVHPPQDLLDKTMTASEAESLMRIWQGGGMAWDTFYANMQRGGIATPERDAEQEYALISADGLPTDGQQDPGLGP